MTTTTAALIRQTSVEELRALADELFVAHYEEVALHKDVMKLSPDWDRYFALQESGNLILIAAWVGSTLVGYSVSFILQHPHYSTLTFAQNDLLFVAEEYRRSRVGLQLIKATEMTARARGAKLLTWHAKQGTALEAILPRVGYGLHEIIFSKEL